MEIRDEKDDNRQTASKRNMAILLKNNFNISSYKTKRKQSTK